MSSHFNGTVSGGTRSGPPPPPVPPPPNIASTGPWSARFNDANSVFGPTPTNFPRASNFTFTPPATSGAPSSSLGTGPKNPSSQPKTAVTITRAASTLKVQPSRKHFKQTVTVVVGIFKQPFILHKGLLCFYSDFFRAALEGSFKEANEGKIELPDVKVEIFEAFQVWLYSRSLHNVEDSQDPVHSSSFPSFVDLAGLWVFGDKYQIPLLQNYAIDALLNKHKEDGRFAIDVVAIAYKETMVNSPLRKLAIEIHVFNMVHKAGENSIFQEAALRNWTQEALVDFARSVSDAWERKLPRNVLPSRERCHYHVHATDEYC